MRAAGLARVSGAALLPFALWGLAGCAEAPDAVTGGGRVSERTPLIVVFPVENLSGGPAPLADVRRLLAARLGAHGLRVLDEGALEAAMTRHRVRYTAGVEAVFAQALEEETRAEAILIPSLEVYDEAVPPRVALFARLVSTGRAPTVRWIDGAGAAGHDSPGILGIGLIEDPGALLERTVDALARSLARHVSDGGARAASRSAAPKFGPKIVFRSDALDPDRPYSVAVVPFFNRSARKHAGEVIALHMMRTLVGHPGLDVVEPGLVREALLRFRIIMNEGVSLPETETILGAVNADLVLNGEVLEYRDPRGLYGAPSVDFGVLFIERRTRRVVYSSYSHNTGDDRVFFFDWGRVNTAHAMASQMARAIGERLLPGPAATGARQAPTGQAERGRGGGAGSR